MATKGMERDAEGYEGVWRTIRGQRVFIRVGEDLESAMDRSGKFKDYFKDDYKMSHRPSTTYGDASNFEENMPDVFEHPEWYDYGQKGYMESYAALKKVRNNPEGEITIYRATTGDGINLGDWVTPSKEYAKQHNYSNLDGKGKIISQKVKAKDITFGGDDLNEWGYFPY